LRRSQNCRQKPGGSNLTRLALYLSVGKIKHGPHVISRSYIDLSQRALWQSQIRSSIDSPIKKDCQYAARANSVCKHSLDRTCLKCLMAIALGNSARNILEVHHARQRDDSTGQIDQVKIIPKPDLGDAFPAHPACSFRQAPRSSWGDRHNSGNCDRQYRRHGPQRERDRDQYRNRRQSSHDYQFRR
jgi:hypothetical protein